MREAMADLGGDPTKINPLAPAELVIDHSVIADVFGTPEAFGRNVEIEYERNRERYQFLRWGQGAFDDFKVVPPGTGIVHQVNIEHLARVVFTRDSGDGATVAYPDTCVGTDSHTTMVNGIGVVGWGVGGIEAEAAMLGQPVSMLIPRVVGFKLNGELPEGATATDLVLTITEMLRKHGVVGKFVEFYGPGVSAVPLANRATIGNMSPEFGSTIAVFPIDQQTLDYLRLTGRPAEQVALVEAYAKEQGLWHDPDAEPRYSEQLELDLSTVVPSPRRPEAPAGPGRAVRRQGDASARRWPTTSTRPTHEEGYDESRRRVLPGLRLAVATRRQRLAAPTEHLRGHRSAARTGGGRPSSPVEHHHRRHRRARSTTARSIIAAITSCTNTSNPSVMIGAALLAKNAVEKGLQRKPWVKTTLAPGSKVVMRLLRAGRPDAVPRQARLQPRRLRLHDLHRQLRPAHPRGQQGRPGQRPRRGLGAVGQPQLRGPDQPRREDELPRVAAAGRRLRAGRLDGRRPLQRPAGPGHRRQRRVPERHLAVARPGDRGGRRLGDHLRDVRPETTPTCSPATSTWQSLPTPTGDTFEWDADSTYVRKPPYFDGMPDEPEPVTDIEGARVLLKLGDSVTTDHISPAGAIKQDSPGRRATSPSTASSSATSTPTARAAATTR